jgi:nucleotide-binding universal stress UspA family protein
MILICYDGSDDARSAIEHVAKLLAGAPATVLTVWEPFVELMARTSSGFGVAPEMVDVEAIDRATRESAEQRAQEGAELARKAGLDAQPRTCSQLTTIADAILSQAEEVDASAIAMGTRGLTRLKSLLLGSVSHAVIQRTDRTVIVVPSPDVAAARGRALHSQD